MDDQAYKVLKSMANSTLLNYGVPGIRSKVIGGPYHGKVRMFHATHDSPQLITPHSHRYDFACLVLKGSVLNRVLNRVWKRDETKTGGVYQLDELGGGQLGEVKVVRPLHGKVDIDHWHGTSQQYRAGGWYSMAAHEIHDITFQAGTEVLFFEGPEVVVSSLILQPWVNGKVVPTLKIEPWMFMKEDVK